MGNQHGRRDEGEAEVTTLPATRLATIDHTTRNTAEVVNGLGYQMENLGNVATALSSERRLMAADRVKLEALYGPHGAVAKLERKVEDNHTETVGEIRKLRDFMMRCMGIATGAGVAAAAFKAIVWMLHH